MIRENVLTPNDFIVPLFVVEGKNIRESIPSMPGYSRMSLDLLAVEVKSLWQLGLKAVLVFVKVPDHLKDNKGKEALNKDGLMQRSVKTIKDAVPEMVVMTDVALDPYSSFGHDGIVEEGKVVNDPTVEVLSQMALRALSYLLHREYATVLNGKKRMVFVFLLSVRELLVRAMYMRP